jgi:ATP-dependent protease ClpP protease subunit
MLNEIKLYGVIGEDVSAVDVKNAIDGFDQTQPLLFRIHSEGGSVSDGLAIYDAIKAYAGPKKAIIESAAFSIASHIAMAFDDVEITENGYLMIHNPHMDVSGDDSAHAQAADCLSKLKESMVTAYSSKTGKPREEVLAIMAAETWVNAKEALSNGYVSRITPPQLKAVAKMKNMPQGVAKSLSGDCLEVGETREDDSMSTTPVAASLQEIKAAFPKAKAEFILSCIERQLPMASVMSDALAAMDEELTTAKAKLAQYEQTEQAKAMEDEKMAKAKAMEIEVEEEKPDETMAKAKAKTGVKPVAKSTSSSKPSAKAQWDAAVASYEAKGIVRGKALSLVNKANPGLREQMLAEVS